MIGMWFILTGFPGAHVVGHGPGVVSNVRTKSGEEMEAAERRHLKACLALGQLIPQLWSAFLRVLGPCWELSNEDSIWWTLLVTQG